MLESPIDPLSPSVDAWVASRRPGWSLPRGFYTDPGIFAADLERVFRRSWLYAGHIARIPRPNDWFTYECAGWPLIVARGNDGAVHAFANVCRHRGSRICDREEGHSAALVCPYHQWAYSCEGHLIAAKRTGDGFDRASFGLKPVPVRVTEGFIFVHLGECPTDFSDVQQAAVDYLAPHRLSDAKICHTERYHVRANWKLIIENSRECYHCPGGHPEYSRIMLVPQHCPADERRDAAKSMADRVTHYQKHGLRTELRRGSGWHISRDPFARRGAVSESLDGRPVAPDMVGIPGGDAGVTALIVQPTFMLEASPDYTMCLRFVPIAADRTDVRIDWFVRPDAVPGRDFRIEDVTAFWKATAAQDWKLCEDNHAGIDSEAYQPGPYIPGEEDDVERFVRWYLDRLAGC
jgi:phenylpropionate dioxygenase-like ring-hydroxylating dioxygenase large terminal subunit